MISQFCESQQTIRIMLTSRPYLHVLQSLSESAIIIDIRANDDDVCMYLTTRLERVRFISAELKNEIKERLSPGAQGMYKPSVKSINHKECSWWNSS